MGGESLISSLPQLFLDMGILGLWIRPISLSLNNNKGIILLGGMGGGGRSGLCRRLSGTHMLGRWLIFAVGQRPAICLTLRLLGCRLTACPRSRPALSLLGLRKKLLMVPTALRRGERWRVSVQVYYIWASFQHE